MFHHLRRLLRDNRGQLANSLTTTMALAAALAAGLGAEQIIRRAGWTMQDIVNRGLCWIYQADRIGFNDDEAEACRALEQTGHIDPVTETWSPEQASRIVDCDAAYRNSPDERSRCHEAQRYRASRGQSVGVARNPALTPWDAYNRARNRRGGTRLCDDYLRDRRGTIQDIIRTTGMDPKHSNTLGEFLRSGCSD
jgi:hypothetical protein